MSFIPPGLLDGQNNVPDGKEVGAMLFVEEPGARSLLAGYMAFFIMKGIIIPTKDFKEDLIKEWGKGCKKYSDNSESVCSRIINNVIWQTCQIITNFKPCDDVSYQNGSSDIIWSPYFWGGLGAFLGILMVTVEFLMWYCLCLKRKRTGKKGGSKEKGKFKGSGSQETPQTPGTDSKSPMVGNGNQKSPGGGGFGNGKKYQPGVSPNHETYMY